MPRQLTQLTNNEIYHVVLRAVGDNSVFNDENDYYRGIFSIYEFNNASPVNLWERRQQRKRQKAKLVKLGPTPLNISLDLRERDMFVETLLFSFMPNHIHLLLRQLKENGISRFMQKVGGGYAAYFNKKYNRKGHLFNRFKAVRIDSDEQLKNVFTYIHMNRISLIEPNWKENGIKNSNEVIEFLENDRWHSYLDYLGKKNFPSVTKRDFILEVMGGENGCKEDVDSRIKYRKDYKDFSKIDLE